MAITSREIKNKRTVSGELTGKCGLVYDVNIKYKVGKKMKTYSKKGIPTKKDAIQLEAEMKVKLTNPSYVPPTAARAKLTIEEYMNEWIENHGKVNLRPSTFASYKSHMRNHIFPHIGNVPLGRLTPAMLDNMFQQLYGKGLSNSSVRYAHRIVGVAMEHARKYHYIESNPARDIITKFGKQGKTPDPYTVEEIQLLLSKSMGTPWEMIVVLGGLYGLRLSEIIGLRWRNVDLENETFSVIEQMPYAVPKGTKEIVEMAPVKSSGRVLPITKATRPYFERQLELQKRQKDILKSSGGECYNSDLVVAKADGSLEQRDRISANFGQLLRRLEMRHIRFHDLRHSAATNIHQLTGDFYTVSQILGHSLKGVGIHLGISNSLDSATAQYVDVRIDRKRIVLEAYHNDVHRNGDEGSSLIVDSDKKNVAFCHINAINEIDRSNISRSDKNELQITSAIEGQNPVDQLIEQR